MAFGGYTKLFSSILTSTIWRESNETRIMFITMLALANADGVVEASVPGLADLARLPLDACEEALRKLQEPDPYSRTKEHDGRRIEPIDDGWLLLNHGRYRARVDADQRREYLRLKKQESRARAKANVPHAAADDFVNTSQQLSTMSTQAEAEAEADPEEEDVQEHAAGVTGASPASMADPQQLLSAWNELTTEALSRVRELSSARQRAARAALRSRGLDCLREVFRRIEASAFCRGENDRGWRATFDWALKDANIAKVLDGNYDRARSASGAVPGRTGARAGKYSNLDRPEPVERAS